MNPANFGHREREKVNINTNSIRQGTMKTPTAQKVAHRNFIYFSCSTKKLLYTKYQERLISIDLFLNCTGSIFTFEIYQPNL